MKRRWIEPLVLLLAAAIAASDGVRIAVTMQETVGAREAGGWIVLLAGLLGCLALAYGLQLLRRPTVQLPWQMGDNLRLVAIALAILVGYVALMDPLGYMISTALLFTLFLRIYGGYRWTPVVLGSVAVAVLSTYGWSMLGMMLPTGFVPWP